MGCVIDRYKLNPDCICVGCKKYKGTRNDFSKYCEPYPKSLPPKIWNGKDVECKYFERKENND